jgi:Zn-dependent peptidase ImmA (M78 family)
MNTWNNLGDIRAKLLGYRRETVARMAGIALERLEAIEEHGEIPSVFEVDALSRLYGIAPEILGEEPIRLAPGDSVVTLTSLEEFRGLDDVTRARVVAAANAARDLVELRKLAGSPDAREQLKRESPLIESKSGVPYRQGALYASELRRRLNLGDSSIDSLRDLVAERFPSISVLTANLGGAGPAGLSFVDPLRGPTIVLNVEGKNKNPCVRRFSLAHELCHVLVDWNRHQSLAQISGYLNESHLAVEQRANAFAVRFLCPEKVIKKLRDKRALEDVKTGRLLASYGLPYAALRLYLRNEADINLAEIPPPALSALGTEARWVAAEDPAGLSGFPLPEVPLERRTVVAHLAARLYSDGKIRRDRFADLLGVTPTADVESVLDFFAFDVPKPGNAASVA